MWRMQTPGVIGAAGLCAVWPRPSRTGGTLALHGRRQCRQGAPAIVSVCAGRHAGDPTDGSMSSPSNVAETPITDRRTLVDYLAAGARTKADWRIGTEHEKFGFRLDDLRPPTFDGERGIEALLKGLTRFGWAPVEENGRVIALSRDGASVSLEPAGQLELSGAELETLHDTCRETGTHLREVREVADPMGLGFLGMGFPPKWRRDEMP